MPIAIHTNQPVHRRHRKVAQLVMGSVADFFSHNSPLIKTAYHQGIFIKTVYNDSLFSLYLLDTRHQQYNELLTLNKDIGEFTVNIKPFCKKDGAIYKVPRELINSIASELENMVNLPRTRVFRHDNEDGTYDCCIDIDDEIYKLNWEKPKVQIHWLADR